MASYLNEADSDEGETTANNEESLFSEEYISEILLINEKLKADGNAAFARNEFEEAIKFYSEAIENLKKTNQSKNSIYHLNRCASYLALPNFVKALHDANIASEIDPTNWKGHWRKGVALMSMSKRAFRTKMAIKAFEECLQCSSLPANKVSEVQRELEKANRVLQKQDEETPPADLSRCAQS